MLDWHYTMQSMHGTVYASRTCLPLPILVAHGLLSAAGDEAYVPPVVPPSNTEDILAERSRKQQPRGAAAPAGFEDHSGPPYAAPFTSTEELLAARSAR